MRTAVRIAVDLLPGAEYAGISVLERGDQRRTVAWSDDVVRVAEEADARGAER
jgi:hypothetical protein